MIEKIFGYDWQNHVYFQEINDFLPKFVIDTHTHGSPPTKLINMINERALTPGESFNYFPIELYINIFKKIVPGIKYHQVIFGFPHTIGREEETNKYLAKKSLKLINFRPVAIYAPEAPPTKKYLSDFCGLKMYRPLDRPKNEVKIIDFFSEKTLKIINELEKSIVIHLPENLLQNINELMILSEKYKKIKFILAHMGVMYLNSPNYYPAALKEISKRPNIYLDTAMVSDPEVFINALKYLGYKKIPTEDLIGKKGANQLNMRVVSVDKLKDYSCEDADLTLRLKQAIDPDLDKSGLRKLFEEIEMPLVRVLADMEMAGVTINVGELNEYAKVLRLQIIKLEEEIIGLAGEAFNLSSPKQLGPILFEKLKIDPHAPKTKTQQYSTSEDVLIKFKDKHPIINKILEHRGLKKLLNTYVETLPELINKRTGKIHSSFNQAIAATGRLSSNNPNLQNIPIRDENGREIRKAFIPSGSDYLFLSADYSQIELRIMAALSNDEQMIQAFSEGKDIHALTASKIYNVPVELVTSDMRRKAKTANFGIIYGISAFGLSERLNIPRSEAKELIDGYFRNFPGIKKYMDESIKNARNEGFVQTIKGRKRYLSDINSVNSVVRGMAERNAINTPIQGSAADIIKIAMVNIFRRFGEEGIKSKMTMQVHDELDFNVYKPELQMVMQMVKTEMENAVSLKVPLTIEMQAASNWLDAH